MVGRMLLMLWHFASTCQYKNLFGRIADNPSIKKRSACLLIWCVVHAVYNLYIHPSILSIKKQSNTYTNLVGGLSLEFTTSGDVAFVKTNSDTRLGCGHFNKGRKRRKLEGVVTFVLFFLFRHPSHFRQP
jgi:hypothetical protein